MTRHAPRQVPLHSMSMSRLRSLMPALYPGDGGMRAVFFEKKVTRGIRAGRSDEGSE